MNYTEEQVTKDFLVEIAKAVELIQNSGLICEKISLEFQLPHDQFVRAFNHFSLKTQTYSKRPEKEFKINFSGVEVRFHI